MLTRGIRIELGVVMEIVSQTHTTNRRSLIDTQALCLKLSQIPTLELPLVRHLNRKRIYELLVDQDFIMQMRSGRESG